MGASAAAVRENVRIEAHCRHAGSFTPLPRPISASEKARAMRLPTVLSIFQFSMGPFAGANAVQAASRAGTCRRPLARRSGTLIASCADRLCLKQPQQLFGLLGLRLDEFLRKQLARPASVERKASEK